jgi:hypothetical protein
MEIGHQSYKRKLMYPVVMNYLQSGLNREDFCKQNNLSIHKLCYWYRKYKHETQSEESFVPVKLDETPPITKSPEEMKIIFPNGVVVHLFSSAPENIIRSLIS